MIRVELPQHLRTRARVDGEVTLEKLILVISCSIFLAVVHSSLPATAATGEARPESRGKLIHPDNADLRFTGHWDKSQLHERAVTINSGSRIEGKFSGKSVSGIFGTQGITSPAHIYVTIDGGAPVFYKTDSPTINFTPHPLKGRSHTLEIDVKDVDERVNRWNPPLAAALIFEGLLLDRKGKTLPLPPPPKLKMEFYGDSITQGVAALAKKIGPDGADGTKDYAFLVARALGAAHNQIGFGRQGIIREGNGNVPTAPQALGWNFAGSPADSAFIPDIVVVNQGTNDRAFSSEQFLPAYRAYIEKIRQAYPRAAIFCLRPFGGAHASDIQTATESLADANIFFVDTTGWLDKPDYTDGTHPTVAGHVKAARRLADVISGNKHLKPVREIGETR